MATEAQRIAAQQARTARFNTRVQWLGEQVQQGLRMGMQARVRLCAQLVRDKTVINVSTPVRKIPGRRGRDPVTGRFTAAKTRVDPTSRSRPGEFPHADTTRLMTDIYYDVQGADRLTAIVGTTLDYGLVLETQMDRSFLARTLNEMQPVVRQILTSGRGGNTNFRNT